MKPLTIEDIAKRVGVAPSTVSRVINNQIGARSKVRDRILQVIEETGFQPNPAARSLVSQKSNVIGLLVPAPASQVLANLYFLQLVEFITQACEKNGYILSLFLSDSIANETRLLPKITRQGFVDGLIVRLIEGRKNDPLLEGISRKEIPFIVSGRPPDPQGVSYIAADNYTAAYQALTHLLRLGRKRIAVIPGILEAPANLERLACYRKVLNDRGLPIDERLIAVQHDGYAATQQVLRYKPDAIFLTPRMVLDVLRALREAGLRVPEDVALVGFDDVPLALQTEPQLTTLRQPTADMGKQLVENLLDIIEFGADPPRHVIFQKELVIRQSCGASSNLADQKSN